MFKTKFTLGKLSFPVFFFLNSAQFSQIIVLVFLFNLYIGCFLKFHIVVGVEEWIVNALYRLRITDQLFKSYVLH
jgi:hypothetical protein